MATPTSDRPESQRRRLPKLIPSEPAAGSSDDTPRTAMSDESARQRRRTQQRLARQQTPDLKETVLPPMRQDVIQTFIRDLPEIYFFFFIADFLAATCRTIGRTTSNETSKSSSTCAILVSSPTSLVFISSTSFSTLDLNYHLSLHSCTASKTKWSLKDRKSTAKQHYLIFFFPARTRVRALRKVLQHLVSTSRIRVSELQRICSEQIFLSVETFTREKRSEAEVRFGNRTGTSPFGIGFTDQQTFHQQTAEVLKRYTVQVARQTHGVFQRIFTFIHGINSGYALWFCIFAYVFTQSNAYAFFDTYRSIALISHVLFYLFLALCIVDVLDR